MGGDQRETGQRDIAADEKPRNALPGTATTAIDAAAAAQEIGRHRSRVEQEQSCRHERRDSARLRHHQTERDREFEPCQQPSSRHSSTCRQDAVFSEDMRKPGEIEEFVRGATQEHADQRACRDDDEDGMGQREARLHQRTSTWSGSSPPEADIVGVNANAWPLAGRS